jgi:ABC-type proline/glycine betaine transport system permease subunit
MSGGTSIKIRGTHLWKVFGPDPGRIIQDWDQHRDLDKVKLLKKTGRVLGFLLVQIDDLFNRIPRPVMLLALMALAWVMSGWRIGILVGVSLFFLGSFDLGVGVEAGLGILIIAIVLDRILQGLTRRQKKALMRE